MVHENARAERRAVKEGAGSTYWQQLVESHAADVSRRFGAVGAIYWEPAGSMPLDVFSYSREATLCFSVARFLSTIVLASSIVEVILNRDSRTRNAPFRRIGGWATLNNENLAAAADLGLPTRILLSNGEVLGQGGPIRFVQRRNKVAHGEIADLFQRLSDYDPVAETEAFDQLQKSNNFLIEWFNTAPDVQESRIRGHIWPQIA